MHSLATNCKKWTFFTVSPLFSLVFMVILSACSDEKSFSLPPPPKDTTPPSIESSLPDESTSNNFEVDSAVEIIFTERMNIDSLVIEEGIKLFSGLEDLALDPNETEQKELSIRESSLFFSESPVTSKDMVTGEDIQVPATKVVLRHASGRFALNTAYTVKVASPARDLVEDDKETAIDERNFIEGTNVVDFITEKGHWKIPQVLPNIALELDGSDNEIAVEQTKNQLTPSILSNKRGDTFTLWLQEGLTPGINQLWFSRYLVNEKTWSLANVSKQICLNGQGIECANSQRIDGSDDTSTLEYQAAINDIGQIAVVWSKASLPGGFVSIWANIYDGEAWLGETEISSTGLTSQNGDADSPQVGIDNFGNVVSIWREYDGQTTRIKTNLFQADSAQWTEAPAFIDSISTGATQNPVLAMDDKGLAIAIWSEEYNQKLRIFSNRIRLSQSDDWQTPIQIDMTESVATGNSTQPKVAIDSNGDAIAIWLMHDGVRNNLWYNRFTGNWGNNAIRLEEDRTGDADYPSIVFSRDNKALVTWTQINNLSNNRVHLKARFFEAETGWETEQTISSDNQIRKPVASFDREGNANVIWQNELSLGRLDTSYYSKLTDSWSQPENLTLSGNNARLAPLFEDGRFLSVWEQIDNSTYRLNFNRFSD